MLIGDIKCIGVFWEGQGSTEPTKPTDRGPWWKAYLMNKSFLFTYSWLVASSFQSKYVPSSTGVLA